MNTRALVRIEQVNKEIWLVLSLLAIALALDFTVGSDRLLLQFYTIPTVASAYLYGRRHATLTAFASVLIVVLLLLVRADTAPLTSLPALPLDRWVEVAGWGGMLIVTGYLMGTLYERNTRQLGELRSTYEGVLVILRHVIAQDEYTESHSYRVAEYAARIGSVLGFNSQQLEDTRTAALLHDIGKLQVSRELLHKAARLNDEEFARMRCHVDQAGTLLQPLGGALRRIVPIILAHHDKFDGSGYRPNQGDAIPLEARVISVADAYDALTSDRPYRKAMAPHEVKSIIAKGAGHEFDPQVVDAFLIAFRQGALDVVAAAV